MTEEVQKHRNTINKNFTSQSLSKSLPWLPLHINDNDTWIDATGYML